MILYTAIQLGRTHRVMVVEVDCQAKRTWTKCFIGNETVLKRRLHVRLNCLLVGEGCELQHSIAVLSNTTRRIYCYTSSNTTHSTTVFCLHSSTETILW